MTSFHSATFRLLRSEAQVSCAAVFAVESAERRLGFRLPPSVREWYCNDEAIDILAKYSNQDRPIPLEKFAATEWNSLHLLPFKYENQGVCIWSICLDGSDDPPVYVGVDSDGKQWNMQAPTFSAHVYSCVWDHAFVLNQPALVQAQNEPLSEETVGELRRCFSEQRPTFAWPGSRQHRFVGKGCAILIWAADEQADWFVGARDAKSLEAALRIIWGFDGIGSSLYDCSEFGRAALEGIRSGA